MPGCRRVFAALLLGLSGAAAVGAEPESPNEALDLALEATEGAGDQFETAQAIGRFEATLLGPHEREPTVKSAGRFIAIFDDGKCRVDFEFDRNMRLGATRDRARKETVRLVSAGVERTVVLTGGGSARAIEFTNGVRTERIHESFGAACVAAGFPFRDPFILGHDDPRVQRLFEERGDKNWETFAEGGKIVVRIPNRCELIADPAAGHHITSYDEWDDAGRPTLQTRTAWKQASGVWFVSRAERISDLRRHELGYWSRGEARMLSFVPNISIDPSLFRPEAVAEPLAPVIMNPTSEDASTLRSAGEAP